MAKSKIKGLFLPERGSHTMFSFRDCVSKVLISKVNPHPDSNYILNVMKPTLVAQHNEVLLTLPRHLKRKK